VREWKPAEANARIVHRRSIVGVLTVEQGQADRAISSAARFRAAPGGQWERIKFLMTDEFTISKALG
jgi:hypothetical protein